MSPSRKNHKVKAMAWDDCVVVSAAERIDVDSDKVGRKQGKK